MASTGRSTGRASTALVAMLLAATAACAEPQPERAQAPRPITAKELSARVAKPEGKATLVNLWATWCGPCRRELPDLVKLEATHRDAGLRLVMVSLDTSVTPERIAEYLETQGARFPTWIRSDTPEAFRMQLPVSWNGMLPTTWLFDAKGELSGTWEGRSTFEDLDAAVRKVLEPAPTK